MLKDDVDKLEEVLKRGPLDEAKRRELLSLAGRIKAELAREERSPESLKQALSSLELAAAEFETSHPDLARAINDVSLMLSRVGI